MAVRVSGEKNSNYVVTMVIITKCAYLTNILLQLFCIILQSMECNKFIEDIYLSKEINTFIASINPASLQDDLRQELALALLSIDCDKIKEISASNGLIGYSIKILSNMAFSSTSPFYKKFKKDDYDKAIAYLRSQMNLPMLDSKLSKLVNERLVLKYTIDEMEAHEAILFNKYVEMRSCQQVADYYSIPLKHVKDVIRKTKQELKALCTSQF